MKKIIIMSLLATLVSVFNASAQDNTYSIVIKMANGTTLTIGPNEADSIFFDEGKLNVTGQNIEMMMKNIQENRQLCQENRQLCQENRLLCQENRDISDMLREVVRKLEYKTEEIEMIIQVLQNKTEVIEQNVSKNTAQILEQEANINKLENDVKSIAVMVFDLQERNDEMNKKIERLENEVATKDDIAVLFSKIHELEEIIESLQNK